MSKENKSIIPKQYKIPAMVCGAFALGGIAATAITSLAKSRKTIPESKNIEVSTDDNKSSPNAKMLYNPSDIKELFDILGDDPKVALKKPQNVCVIGAGAFGTAMAYAISKNKHNVRLWMRDSSQRDTINETRQNPKKMSQYKLPDNIKATCDLAAAVKDCILIIMALPCQKTPEWLRENKDIIPPKVLICNTAKGLYVPTKQLLSHAITDALGRDQPLAFFSGPSFAEEILKNFPTAVIVASKELYLAVMVQLLFSNLQMRVYTSQDVVGVQLGGALKNPLAIGAGMIAGLGYGINTLTAAVTRSAQELTSLCIAMGGQPETIAGLAGIGDLMLTCSSAQSRNNRCGRRIVKGDKISDIQKDMTVEGIPTASVAVAYADMCGLDLPIFRTVNMMLTNEMLPTEAVAYLMGRPLRAEKKSP